MELTEQELKSLIDTSIVASFDAKVSPLVKEIQDKLGKLEANKLADTMVKEKDDKIKVAERTVAMFKALLQKDFALVKDLAEGASDTGGYLVPTEFQAEVLRIIPTYGLARKYCRILPMGALTKTIPKLLSGVTAYWIDEAGAKTKSSPSFGQLTLTTRKLCGLCPATDELLADSAIDVFNLLAVLFAEAFAKEEDNTLFNSNVSGHKGILNATGVHNVALSDKSILKMTADDLLDMVDAVDDFSETNGRFFLNRTVLSVIRTLKDVTSGQYIFAPMTAAAPGTIWGYPYERTPLLKGVADDAVSTKFIVFGDLQNVIIGDRQQMAVKISDQATIGTTNLYEQDMQAIRIVERLDIQVAIPGAFAYGKTKAS